MAVVNARRAAASLHTEVHGSAEDMEKEGLEDKVVGSPEGRPEAAGPAIAGEADAAADSQATAVLAVDSTSPQSPRRPAQSRERKEEHSRCCG